MTPKIMKKYEKGTLKVHRFLDGFSRALDTESDPKNHEKVWKKYLKSGPVTSRFQSSFSYRKWPQKSLSVGPPWAEPGRAEPSQRKSRKSRPSKKCPFSLKFYWKLATFSSRLDRGTRLVKKIMKRPARRLRESRDNVWYHFSKDTVVHVNTWIGPVFKLIQSSFRYRKWPQKSLSVGPPWAEPGRAEPSQQKSRKSRPSKKCPFSLKVY